ncbi:MAG: hypothetical protein MUE69_12115 [Myxococcota bacterium]|jgi:hypothetical protein|nr:hypothetical protein [Myxococcota bacterium]
MNEPLLADLPGRLGQQPTELPVSNVARQPRTRSEGARILALVVLGLGGLAAHFGFGVGSVLLLIGTGLAAYAHPYFFPAPRLARVGATASAVLVDRGEGVERIERHELRAATLRWVDGAPTLTLRTFTDRWVIRVRSIEEAASFLAASGIEETTRPHAIHSPDLDLWVLVGLVFASGAFAAFGIRAGGLAALASLAGTLLVAAELLPAVRRRVTSAPVSFGEEVFEWRGPNVRRRIAYEDLRQVRKVGPNRLLLVDVRGRSETLELFDSADPDTQRVADELRRRVVAARRVETPPLLAFEGSFAEWIARLERVGRGTYRDAAVDSEQMMRVLEEPMAPPLARVGAAIALGALAGPAPVRARVSALAEGEPPELASAFAELADGRIAETTLARVAAVDG